MVTLWTSQRLGQREEIGVPDGNHAVKGKCADCTQKDPTRKPNPGPSYCEATELIAAQSRCPVNIKDNENVCNNKVKVNSIKAK